MSFFKYPVFNSSSNIPETQSAGASSIDVLSTIGTWVAVLLALLTIIIQVYKYFKQNAEVSNIFFIYSKPRFFVFQSNLTHSLQVPTRNINTYHLTQIHNHFNNPSSGVGGDINTAYSYTIEEVAWFWEERFIEIGVEGTNCLCLTDFTLFFFVGLIIFGGFDFASSLSLIGSSIFLALFFIASDTNIFIYRGRRSRFAKNVVRLLRPKPRIANTSVIFRQSPGASPNLPSKWRQIWRANCLPALYLPTCTYLSTPRHLDTYLLPTSTPGYVFTVFWHLYWHRWTLPTPNQHQIDARISIQSMPKLKPNLRPNRQEMRTKSAPS